MKRVLVDSNEVVSVGYDRARRILEVEFPGAWVFDYFDVPETVFYALLRAESKGGFIDVEVKPRYRFEEAA